MACEGHSEAQVWFRYGTNDWTVFKSSAPLSYETVQTNAAGGQCAGYLYLCYGTAINGNGIEIPWRSAETLLAPITGIIISGDGSLNFPNTPLIQGQPKTPGSSGTSLLREYTQGSNLVYGFRFLKVGTIPVITQYVRVDGGADNCGVASCTFKILSATGAILYQKTASTCPEVVIKCGDTCPPETCCECDSGERVCCYGNDGTAIYSYLK